MDIEQRQAGEALELVIQGRLDSYWADHLTGRLNEVIQQGHHHLRLNLTTTSYLSSAGIGVLVQFYRQLKAINGSFVVVEPSPQVEKILGIAGLTQLLLTPATKPATPESPPDEGKKVEIQGVRYEVFNDAPGESLEYRVVGEPALLRGCRFGEEHSTAIPFPEAGFALGLGAIGPDFASCRERFGEFLSVGGAAAYLPTDGTNTPDYLVSAGGSAPDLSVLYGLECRGKLSHLARFEAANERGSTTLSNLAESALTIAGAKAAGIVIVAESNGLIGAALRRSPATNPAAAAPFAFPGIREWLSFTPERVFRNAVAVLVGVVQREGDSGLNGMVRPLGSDSAIRGHFHAAVFTYGPIQRGRIDLRGTVTRLFETEKLQTVLHLLHDDRPIAGAGESEFTRGACWIGPLAPAAEKGATQ